MMLDSKKQYEWKSFVGFLEVNGLMKFILHITVAQIPIVLKKAWILRNIREVKEPITIKFFYLYRILTQKRERACLHESSDWVLWVPFPSHFNNP